MDMGQQPSGVQAPMPGGADAAGGQDQGFELCIYCTPDGKLTVSKEPIDQQEEGGEPPGQPAASIGEALKMVLQMYQDAATGGAANAQMMQGFKSTAGGIGG